MDRLYGIRPDYCLALRLIACQEFSRRNQEFVEKHFGEIFMEREMEAEIERLEARIAELTAALKPFALTKAITHGEYGEVWVGVVEESLRVARAAYRGEKE